VLGPADGVRLGVALSLTLNLVLLVRHRRAVDARSALLLLVPAVVATPVLARLLRSAPVRLAEALAGAAALLGAAALAAGLQWRAARGRAGAVAAGVLSAGSNVVAAIGGPPVALYAANAGWPAETTRATLQLYFLVLNTVALAALGTPDVELPVLATGAAALAAGLLAGAPLARRVPETAAQRTTLALAAAGGLAVLVGALL
jgi:uncharacterized membrane protein YfcA